MIVNFKVHLNSNGMLQGDCNIPDDVTLEEAIDIVEDVGRNIINIDVEWKPSSRGWNWLANQGTIKLSAKVKDLALELPKGEWEE